MVADLYRNRGEQVAQELDAFLAEELTGPCVKRIVRGRRSVAAHRRISPTNSMWT